MPQPYAREHRWRLWLAGIAMVLATVPWAAFLAWVIWSILEVQPPPTVQAGWLLPAQLVSSAVIVALAGWTTLRLWRGLMGAVRRSINWWGCPRCGFSLRGLRAELAADGGWRVTCPECGRWGTVAAVAVLGDGTVATEADREVSAAADIALKAVRQRGCLGELVRLAMKSCGLVFLAVATTALLVGVDLWRTRSNVVGSLQDIEQMHQWRKPISPYVERALRRMHRMATSSDVTWAMKAGLLTDRHPINVAIEAWQVYGFYPTFLDAAISASSVRHSVRDDLRGGSCREAIVEVQRWITEAKAVHPGKPPDPRTGYELFSGLAAGVRMAVLEALARAEEGDWPGAAEMLIAADLVGRAVSAAAPTTEMLRASESRDVILATVARLVREWPPESFLGPIIESGMLSDDWLSVADARLALRGLVAVGAEPGYRFMQKRPLWPLDELVGDRWRLPRLKWVVERRLFFTSGRLASFLPDEAKTAELVERVTRGDQFAFSEARTWWVGVGDVVVWLDVFCIQLAAGHTLLDCRARAILLAIACQRHILQTGQTPGTLDDLRASGLLPDGLHPLVRPGRDIRLAVRRLPGRPPLVVVSSGNHLQVATRYADEGGVWFPYEGSDLELPVVKHPGGVAAAEAERPKFLGTRAPP